MGSDLTIDLNLARDNPPASMLYVVCMLAIKTNYMCKPDQYYSIFQLFSLFTAFTTHVEVSILQCETVDFRDLTCYK